MFDGRSGRADLRSCFVRAVSKLREVTDESELFRRIFVELRALPEYVESQCSFENEREVLREI